MAIFKALTKKQNTTATENIFMFYYYIGELKLHYTKIINDKNIPLFEFQETDFKKFMNTFDKWVNDNYHEIKWLGETKFDKQTKELLDKLRLQEL
jgi:hypothetical protein